MKGAIDIFRFLTDRADAGERVALVTLTAVDGSSSRAPGTHMAVSESGAFAGSFSGGCVEAAVVAEAQRVIAAGRAETVRFGAGSRYIDIRLPCGGGIDLFILPDPARAVVRAAHESLIRREPAVLALSEGMASSESASLPAGWDGGRFIVRHEPELRVVIAGHGAEPAALARLVTTYGAQSVVLSPDQALVEAEHSLGRAAHRLAMLGPSKDLRADAWTAVVTLFHDHDWEAALLAQALDSPAFFVGAMGSRRTHADRLEALAALGLAPQDRARVVSPLGLIPAVRDPDTMALSALAQIVAAYGGS